MIVTLDGQRVESPLPGACTLQELIQRVRAAHQDCLIISVALNGTTVPDAELQDRLGAPLEHGVQVDFESGQPAALVRDALRGLALEYGDSIERLAALADGLQSVQPAAAVRGIGGFIQLWETCQRVIVQCSGLLGQDLTQVEHQQRPVQAWFADAVTRLTQLRDALDARDLVLLADIVRYEAPALCEEWQALLNDIADQIPEPAAASRGA